jgi:hypothetical protein
MRDKQGKKMNSVIWLLSIGNRLYHTEYFPTRIILLLLTTSFQLLTIST